MKIIPLCKPVFLSYKDFFFIKTQKTTILQQVTGGNTTNIILKRMLWYFSKLQHSRSTFKENARTFSNISTTQENIAISRKYIMLLFLKHKKQPLEHMPDAETANLVLKRMLELFLKVLPLKKLELQNPKRDYEICPKLNQKLNQWLKTYEMNFINRKTNKEKVLNFVLRFGRSWRAKKTPKLSSEYLVS